MVPPEKAPGPMPSPARADAARPLVPVVYRVFAVFARRPWFRIGVEFGQPGETNTHVGRATWRQALSYSERILGQGALLLPGLCRRVRSQPRALGPSRERIGER